MFLVCELVKINFDFTLVNWDSIKSCQQRMDTTSSFEKEMFCGKKNDLELIRTGNR